MDSLCLPRLYLPRACFLDSFVFRGLVFPLSSTGVSLDCLYFVFHRGFVFGPLCLLRFWAPFVFRHGLVFGLSLSSAFFYYFPSVYFLGLVFGAPLASRGLVLDFLWLPGLVLDFLWLPWARFWTSSSFRGFVFGAPLVSGGSFLAFLWPSGFRFWSSSSFLASGGRFWILSPGARFLDLPWLRPPTTAPAT